jgi:hypothetical protein
MVTIEVVVVAHIVLAGTRQTVLRVLVEVGGGGARLQLLQTELVVVELKPLLLLVGVALFLRHLHRRCHEGCRRTAASVRRWRRVQVAVLLEIVHAQARLIFVVATTMLADQACALRRFLLRLCSKHSPEKKKKKKKKCSCLTPRSARMPPLSHLLLTTGNAGAYGVIPYVVLFSTLILHFFLRSIAN